MSFTLIKGKDIKKQWDNNKVEDTISNDICYYYHEDLEVFMVMNIAEVHHQMKEWKKLLVSGKIHILKENCKTKQINGVDYHILVIQGECTTSFAKGGFVFDNECLVVSGWIYMFRKCKKNRDDVFNWLNKFNQLVLPTKAEKDICCDVCMNEERQCMKTSCCNQNLCEVCVREKKKNECPYCRKEFK